jgi:hypothetical protein
VEDVIVPNTLVSLRWVIDMLGSRWYVSELEKKLASGGSIPVEKRWVDGLRLLFGLTLLNLGFGGLGAGPSGGDVSRRDNMGDFNGEEWLLTLEKNVSET